MFEDCPDLANFYEEIVTKVSAFSLQLEVGDNKEERLTLSQSWPEDCHPFKSPESSFVAKAHDTIKDVMDAALKKHTLLDNSDTKGT